MSKDITAERILALLELYFPAFSKRSFFEEQTVYEKAQWLYLLVYKARFEFISHFLFGPYSDYIKTGEQFLEGLHEGQGGVCLERVMALKFLLELFEIGQCSFAMGGSLPGTNQPIDVDAVAKNLLDPEKKQISSYAHHAAVIITIEGEEWFMDPNGGRLGQIFLNPAQTKLILNPNPEEKFGIAASFGQMFYHRVNDDLFNLAVSYRRGSQLEMLELICRVGLIVGPNFDVFLIPKNEIKQRLPALYPPRVQTQCWQINGNLLEALARYNLSFDKTPGNDLFIQNINSAFSILNEISKAPLQMVLRISNQPWESFTRLSPPLSESLMMR